MKEIKFRAWHKAEKKMCAVTLLRPNEGAFLLGIAPAENEVVELHGKASAVIAPTDGRFCEWDEFELLEFIGRKDKNGEDIYEGGIVNYSVKKHFCKSNGCDDRVELGVSKFCPSCGREVRNEDFITTAKVVFDNAGFAYRNENKDNTYQSWSVYAAEIYIAWVEIIGNIYENPELLK